MKQSRLFLTGLLALVALSFTDAPQILTGRWQQKDSKGAMLQVNFRTDSSYTITTNGKYALGGKYYVSQDTLRISDPACSMNYYGIYKLDFFAPDSVRLTVVQDPCAGRRNAYDKSTIGRVRAQPLNSSK